MAPPFRATASLRNNSASTTLVIPALVEAPDYGLLVVTNNDGMGVPSTPAGWSVVLATQNIGGKQRFTIFGKAYEEGDADPIVTWGTSSNNTVLGIWYSDVSGVGVIGSFIGAVTGAAATADAISTLSDDNEVIAIGTHYFGGSGSATSATVAPDFAIAASIYGGGGTFQHSIVVADLDKAVAGATNDQTFTFDSTGTAMGGIQLSLTPTLPDQEWRPTTDTGATIAGWSKTPSGAASVAAVLADDDPATYIESGDNPVGLVWQSETFTLDKPADMTTVKVKVSGYMPTGTTGDRTIALYQGTTLIKQQAVTLTDTDTTTTMSLSSTEASSITVTTGQWEDLSVKVTDTAS